MKTIILSSLSIHLLTISHHVNGFAPSSGVLPTTTSTNSQGISQIVDVSPRLSHIENVVSKSISRRTSTTARYAATEGLAEPTLDVTETSSEEASSKTLARGLLLSSFSDGLVPNPQAIDFFMDSLVESMWNQHLVELEKKVESSVMASPCCGPTDMDSFNQFMDVVDDDDEEKDNESADENSNCGQWKVKFAKLLEQEQQQDNDKKLELRFLYIPTAMYALRKDSNNSPGKQRQRARADGKKRRTQIVQLIQDQFAQAYTEICGSTTAGETKESPVNVLTVSLDFDDDSLKQPEGSKDSSKFPSTGVEALQDWKPHLIYVQGGNTFWLYHCMEKGNYMDALMDAITIRGGDDKGPTTLYCGTSAGAILAGSSMDTATWKEWDDPTVVPDRPNYEDWKDISGLDVMGENVSLFPHMTEQWQDMVEGKMERLNAEHDHAATNSSSDDSSSPKPEVYCLRDDQALCIDGRSLGPSRTLLEC